MRKRNKKTGHKNFKASYKKWLWAAFIFLSLFTVLYFHKDIIRYGYMLSRFFEPKSKALTADVIMLPANYKVFGIDVSRYQYDIKWNALKGLDKNRDTIVFKFAIIKATEGLFWEDPTFVTNWKQAHQNKIICGAYHYFKPHVSARMQALNFINSVTLQPGDLPPVIDVEEIGTLSKQELKLAVTTIATMFEKNYGIKPILYSSINFTETYLADDFKHHTFWIAHYYAPQLKISKNINWSFWQFTDKARLIGSASYYDVNVFKGTELALQKACIKKNK
ncbi:MAG: glycoside hydrolase family 25 protein [Bacteroidia bacterium]|nr:glycoside hydrolase family 25 protein [Bacteroidia bacterium]